jgi:signal peptidase I
METSTIQKRRVPLLAILATLGAPGLGQLYNGEPQKAAVFYFLSLSSLPILSLTSMIWQSPSGLLLLLVIAVGFGFLILVDAWINARKQLQYELRKWNRWQIYLAIILLHVLVIAPTIDGVLFPRPIKAYKVASGAMLPTLQIGDHLVADVTAYRNNRPQRGDVALFEYPVDPTKDFVMRVIGLPGEKIEIRDTRVYVNSNILNDAWGVYNGPNSETEGRKNFGPETIPPNEYFVMGDNRDKSYDSRFWGTVPVSAFKSRALYLYWASEKSRLGQRVQ